MGQAATVTACFEDPNGDLLTYTAASGDPSVATASISGTIVTVTAVAPGIATVTVTASDPEGLQGQARFAVQGRHRHADATRLFRNVPLNNALACHLWIRIEILNHA